MNGSEDQPSKLGSAAGFWGQFLTMNRKNYLLYKRRWFVSSMKIILPALLILLLKYVSTMRVTQEGLLHPHEYELGTIPKCEGKCDPNFFPLLYSPTDNVLVEKIVRGFAKDIDFDFDKEIKGFADQSTMNDAILNKNVFANAALDFGENPSYGFLNISIMYDQKFNGLSTSKGLDVEKDYPSTDLSSDILGRLQSSLMTELHKAQPQAVRETQETSLGGRAVSLAEAVRVGVRTKIYPTPGSTGAGAGSTSSQLMISLYVIMGLVMTFLVTEVVGEKESKIRVGLYSVGLKDLPLWTSWVFTYVATCFLMSVFICGVGYATSFTIFANTNAFVMLLVFFFFPLAMCNAGFLISSFFSRSSLSAFAVILFVFVGFIMQFVLSAIASIITSPQAWIDKLMVYAPFNFLLILSRIAELALPKVGVSGEVIPAPGYHWNDLFSKDQLGYSQWSYLTNMLWNSALYVCLAYYFDAVTATGRSVHFFLQPEFYGLPSARSRTALLRMKPPSFREGSDPDVHAAAQAAFAENYGAKLSSFKLKLGVAIYVLSGTVFGTLCGYLLGVFIGMFKRYALYAQLAPYVGFVVGTAYGVAGSVKDWKAVQEGERVPLLQNPDEPGAKTDRSQVVDVCVCDLKKHFRKLLGQGTKAVDGASFVVKRGQCFALLGHNGAGKTTIVNMITGVYKPTSGAAFVRGRNIVFEMNKTRRLLGVCPQFDVLWPELSGREHLELFASLRGFGGAARSQVVKEALQSIELGKAAEQPVRTYSGGMRRRISVAVAIIGKPPVVFLDEPTTGLDPVSRRKVWNMINDVKKDHCVFLTTHSMEEADILADCIGIMAHGKMHAIGSPVRLKSRHGPGFNITLETNSDAPGEVDRAIMLVYTRIPELRVKEMRNSKAWLNIPRELNTPPQTIAQVLAALEQNTGSGRIVRHWGVSNSSLEDVFLAVNKCAEVEKEAAEEEEADGAESSNEMRSEIHEQQEQQEQQQAYQPPAAYSQGPASH